MSEQKTRVLVYPLKPGGSKHKNFELRFSLRSVAKHWTGGGEVYLLSSIRPEWLSDEVKFVRADGYLEAMRKACDLADEVLWMNDDIYFLKPTGWEDMVSWRRSKKPIGEKFEAELIASKNGWRSRLGQVIRKCREMGLETYKYSSHTPYLYETEKLRECLKIFACGYKTAIETAYGNYYQVPVHPGGDKLRRYHPGEFPLDLSRFRFFNHNDKGLGPHQRGFLQGMFPVPCRFEREFN